MPTPAKKTKTHRKTQKTTA